MSIMRPQYSYFICMTPRTGSSFLCEALIRTGVAGRPEEYYLADTPDGLLDVYQASTHAAVQEAILAKGTGPNGVFGVKLSTGGGGLGNVLATLQRTFPEEASSDSMRQLIERGFPSLRCLFLTRRNKVRQAVSWWRAVQTNQWILRAGEPAASRDGLTFTFDAIDYLVQETVLREAAWQSFFDTVGIVPHTIVYEDMIARPTDAISGILAHLGVAQPPGPVTVEETQKQADQLSEEWVQRYRGEKQKSWDKVVW